MRIFAPHSKLRKCIINTAIVLYVVFLTQVGFDLATAIRNRKVYKTQAYSSQAELESAFEKEKKKLGLENLNINLEIVSDVNEPRLIGECVYYPPGEDYTIRLNEKYKTREALRHELYHAHRIYTGHIKGSARRIDPRFTYEDWIATSYGLKKD